MNKDQPREAEMYLVGFRCDHCGNCLDIRKFVWVWNEHICCSRDHAQLAQAKTNRDETPTPGQKRIEESVKDFEKVKHIFEESDADLL